MNVDIWGTSSVGWLFATLGGAFSISVFVWLAALRHKSVHKLRFRLLISTIIPFSATPVAGFYTILPFDVIPDIGPAGYVDDFVLMAAFSLVWFFNIVSSLWYLSSNPDL
jgi:uncharacterized membrane protein YkvA (DUF1232 family)